MLRGPRDEKDSAQEKPQLAFARQAGRGLLGAECVFLVLSPGMRPVSCL